MHNDWGAEWTNYYFSGKDELYNGWVEDIKKLCKSHHWGYAELADRSFDPVRSDGNTIHLRYLAAVLRVADVLEFDPERTPRVLFGYKQIDEKSRIYWLKDHQVDLAIDLDQSRVIMSARPSSAVNNRAIETMMNDVEAELQLCRNLDLERPFALSSIGPLPHKWVLPRIVQRAFVRSKGTAGRFTNTLTARFDPIPPSSWISWPGPNSTGTGWPGCASGCRMPLTRSASGSRAGGSSCATRSIRTGSRFSKPTTPSSCASRRETAASSA
jgi:hypothetical protein